MYDLLVTENASCIKIRSCLDATHAFYWRRVSPVTKWCPCEENREVLICTREGWLKTRAGNNSRMTPENAKDAQPLIEGGP